MRLKLATDWRYFMTLDELALQTSTDKSSRGGHDYCYTYDDLFSPFRHEPITILELGVQGGDSLVMWSKFFDNPLTQIHGTDIHPEWCCGIEDSRVSLHGKSQADPNLWTFFPDESLDICCDDGSHFLKDQKASFLMGWTKIKPGGFWCIEDTHVHSDPTFSFNGETVMHWLCGMARDMQGLGAEGRGKRGPDRPWSEVDTITFRRGLCIIRKANG